MKRLTLAAVMICAALLASCARSSGNSPSQSSTVKTQTSGAVTTEVEVTEPVSAEKHYAANGAALNIDMSKYSSKARLLTADDIYLSSFNCGYLSGRHPDGMTIIETPEQLEYAGERYGLAPPPDGLTDDELFMYGRTLAEPFCEMAEKYPISEYSYVIWYDEVCSGGYDLRVGALVVDEDSLAFVRTEDSRTPDPDLPQTDEMGGFCYMAAVPKGTLMNDHYERCTYPDRNDLYQDIDFFYSVNSCLSETTELCQLYGRDKGYIVRSEDELNMLVDMSQDVKNSSGERVFSYTAKTDFNKAALLFRFFESEGVTNRLPGNGVIIENNNVTFTGYDPSDRGCTGLAVASIPLRFLPEELSSDWITPEAGKSGSQRAAEVDMSGYSSSARLYTSDDITIYARSIDTLGFAGKYTIFGDDNCRQRYIAADKYGFGKDNAFVRLIERFAGEDYVFFVEYIPELKNDSDIQLNGLVIDGDKAEFVYTDRNSKKEYKTSNGGKGIGFYAAVPVGEIKCRSFDGWEIPTDGTEGDTIEEGWIAVFRSGMERPYIGDQTRETYVYKTDSGYRYVNVTSTKMEYPFWTRHEITGSGEAATKEDILAQAEQNGAALIVTLPGDDDTLCFTNKFMTMDW